MKCTRNKATKEIECFSETNCTLSKMHTRDISLVTKWMTYACGTNCMGASLFGCCSVCEKLKKNVVLGFDKSIAGVTCLGCSEGDLMVGNPSYPGCTFVGETLTCNLLDKCTVGFVNTRRVEESFKCKVINCGECVSQSATKAKCCEECLRHMCYGGTGRYACEGCYEVPVGTPPPGHNSTDTHLLASVSRNPHSAFTAGIIVIVFGAFTLSQW